MAVGNTSEAYKYSAAELFLYIAAPALHHSIRVSVLMHAWVPTYVRACACP